MRSPLVPHRIEVCAPWACRATTENLSARVRIGSLVAEMGGVVEKEKSKDKEGDSEESALAKLDNADPDFRDLYHPLSAFPMSLGDHVQVKTRKLYVAFRRGADRSLLQPGSSSAQSG
jgi:hypothetical protein